MPTLQHRLVRTFVDLADTLVADFDITELLYTLVESLVELFEVSAVGLMLADESGDLKVMASSGEQARIIELLELQQRQGPCYEAYSTGKYVLSDDLAADRHRWPAVADEAMSAGYSTVHAVPMQLREKVVGAINLFEMPPSKLTEDEIPVIRAMAEIATIAILQSRAMSEAHETADHLRVALRSRVILEQAKGMVAQSEGIPLDAAFSLLRAYARAKGQRLADVARRVVDNELEPAALTAEGRD